MSRADLQGIIIYHREFLFCRIIWIWFCSHFSMKITWLMSCLGFGPKVEAVVSTAPIFFQSQLFKGSRLFGLFSSSSLPLSLKSVHIHSVVRSPVSAVQLAPLANFSAFSTASSCCHPAASSTGLWLPVQVQQPVGETTDIWSRLDSTQYGFTFRGGVWENVFYLCWKELLTSLMLVFVKPDVWYYRWNVAEVLVDRSLGSETGSYALLCILLSNSNI